MVGFGNVHDKSLAAGFRALSKIAFAIAVFSAPVAAQAQSVVFSQSTTTTFIGATSSSGTNQDYNASTGRVAANQRGDVFWINDNYSTTPDNLIEVAAGTTTEVALVTNLGQYSASVTVDSHNNLWLTNGTASVIYLPYVNGTYATVDASTVTACAVPVTGTTACNVSYIGSPTLGNYVQLSDLQVDASGNIYGVDYYDGVDASYGNENKIIEYSASTGAATVLLSNLPFSNGGKLAVTASGNIYYADGTSLYYSAAGSNTDTTISSYTPKGVSIDSSGNLYINDTGNNRIVFVPSTSGTLNFSGTRTIYNTEASGAGISLNGMGIDGYGNVVIAGGTFANSIYRLPVGNINLATPISFIGAGSKSGTVPVNLIFSGTSTFGSFLVSGATGTFSTSANTCITGTTYTAGQSCSISVAYTATAAGQQSGIIEALSSTGALLGEARLSGYSYGTVLSVDPGTKTAIGSSWISPSSISVDPAGNTYVADSGTGKIYKNGSTVVASGFSSPSAVVVDPSGNLYVADTGNKRISKVPNVNGAYGAAATIYTGLSGPSGLALDYEGNLYVADSGNSRVLLLAAAGNGNLGTDVSVIGSGFETPVSIAVSEIPNNAYSNTITNIYVGDNGTKNLYQIQLQTGAQIVAATGFTTVGGIAVDQGSNIYIADPGANKLDYLPNYYSNLDSKVYSQTNIAVTSPSAVATDTLGNVYQVDATDKSVTMDNRTAGDAFFYTYAVGSPSFTIYPVLSNSGNSNVVFNSPFYTQAGAGADFSIVDGNCTGYTLYEGSNCYFQVTFDPQTTGPLTDVLTFSSNSPPYTLTLTGIGGSPGTFSGLTVTGVPNPTSVGVPAMITVTAVDENGATVTNFTGTVTFSSSDPHATLPASYTFKASDQGVAQFSVTLNTAGTQSITVSDGSISASETNIVVGDFVWVLNANGTTSQLGEGGTAAGSGGSAGATSTFGGLAFDANGNVWSASSGANALIFTTESGTTPTSYTGGGLSTPVSVAIDGAGSVWVANSGNSTVSEFLNAGTVQSTAGYGGSGGTTLSAPSSVTIDATGGVWVTNKTGNSLTHIFGAAVPVVTPLSEAVTAGTVGQRP